MSTAIDQQLAKFQIDHVCEPTEDDATSIPAWVLQNVRIIVQTGILKEE